MSFSPWSAQFFHSDLWATDLSTLTLWPRFRFRVLRLAIVAAEEFQTNLLNLRAMGLVYSTLLSLVPLLAVTFSILKAFGVHNQIEPLLLRALEPLGSKGEDLAWYMLGFVSNLRVGLLGALGVASLFFTVISLGVKSNFFAVSLITFTSSARGAEYVVYDRTPNPVVIASTSIIILFMTLFSSATVFRRQLLRAR